MTRARTSAMTRTVYASWLRRLAQGCQKHSSRTKGYMQLPRQKRVNLFVKIYLKSEKHVLSTKFSFGEYEGVKTSSKWRIVTENSFSSPTEDLEDIHTVYQAEDADTLTSPPDRHRQTATHLCPDAALASRAPLTLKDRHLQETRSYHMLACGAFFSFFI